MILNRHATSSEGGMYVSTARLFLTADRERVVDEGDPAAAFLLAGAGGLVSAEDVERFGLHDLVQPNTAPPEPTTAPLDTPEDEARRARIEGYVARAEAARARHAGGVTITRGGQ